MAKQHAIARRLNSRRSGLGAIGVNAIDNSRNYSSVGCRHALFCQSFCCANHTDPLQSMRLASTCQLNHAVIVSDLIPLKDAVQISGVSR